MKNFKIISSIGMLFLVVLDLYSKYFAFNALKDSPIVVIDKFFNLSLAFNTGVSFSMFNNLENGAFLLSSIALLAGVFLTYLIFKSKNKYEVVGYALIASGAFGNGIDRMYNGFVIDFLDFYYKAWHYPTFNFADCFIFIGVALLLLEGLLAKR